MPRLAILISGAGSNMRALIEAQRRAAIEAEIALVLSDRAAAGLQIAKEFAIESGCVPASKTIPREEHDAAVMRELRKLRIDFVILAGYMRILSTSFVEAWSGRMLNIHPSLLPRHKGLHTHRRALEAGDTEHGSTVHFVTPDLDGGPPVVQAKFAIRADDTEHSLHARVQTCEHLIYPEAVAWLSSGRLQWRAGEPWLDEQRLQQPVERFFSDQFFGNPDPGTPWQASEHAV